MILEQILREKGGQVYSVPESATLKDAADLLDARKVGAMVILNEAGGVIGVISERDIVRNVARIGAEALKCSVGEVMTRKVVTARPKETLESAMDLMTDRRIRHLPVVEGGRLLGVVSIGDLVKWRIAEAHAEIEAVRSFIDKGLRRDVRYSWRGGEAAVWWLQNPLKWALSRILQLREGLLWKTLYFRIFNPNSLACPVRWEYIPRSRRPQRSTAGPHNGPEGISVGLF
jgi:CBS domain-containing protein